jgi:hypothetical protein
MIGGRIVLDSLSTIVIKYSIDATLKFLRQAREDIRKRGANLMFIVYPGIHSSGEMTGLMRAAIVLSNSGLRFTKRRSSRRSRSTRSRMQQPRRGSYRSS